MLRLLHAEPDFAEVFTVLPMMLTLLLNVALPYS